MFWLDIITLTLQDETEKAIQFFIIFSNGQTKRLKKLSIVIFAGHKKSIIFIAIDLFA